MNSYQVIGKFELEERYGCSRSVVPGETGVTREIPRFNHVGIILVEDSRILFSSNWVQGNQASYMSIPLAVWFKNGSSVSMAAVTYGTVMSLILNHRSSFSDAKGL